MKNKIFEKQLLNLPDKVIWCKNCVMSNQRPRIIFNSEGVCSGCLNVEYKNTINWEKREEELNILLDQHRSKTGDWDVIVPSSGGKDSGYVAHMLKYKYNMNPITVTWAPLEYTEIGKKNLESSIDSGLSNYLFTPNRSMQRKLARLSLEELGDAFHVFVLGQVSYPFHLALKLGINLVFYGENGEAEYAGDPNFFDKPYKPSEEWINQYFKGSNFLDLVNYGIKNKEYLSEKDISSGDLKYYVPPNKDDLKKLGVKGKHFFSYYKKWIPQENFYYCVENTGFRPNLERSEGTYSKYASLDDKMDGFHFYLRFIKFGLGRCSEDASHEIRDGHITRDEGISLMSKYEGEFPKKYYEDFKKYLNITDDDFWEIVDSWRSDKIWKKVNNDWQLKYPIK